MIYGGKECTAISVSQQMLNNDDATIRPPAPKVARSVSHCSQLLITLTKFLFIHPDNIV